MEPVQLLRRIIENMERVIVGKRFEIELTLMALLCQGHVLIEDIPGVGKTSLAAALAKSLHCTFNRIQFTPDIMPSDIIGFSVYNPKDGNFEFRKGAIASQIVLADEINRTSPKTQSSLLEAMEERQVTVDGVTYPLDQPFMVLATQNPVDYLGTYPLPEAQMDRFFIRLSLGYPEKEEEIQMLQRFSLDSPLEYLQAVATEGELLHLQRMAAEIYVDPSISRYIVDVVRHTRRNPAVSLGASPRATIALYKGAQAWALYQGRSYVLPDDVILMSPHVLSHRIILNQQSKLQQGTQQGVVQQALSHVKVPTR